MPAPPDFDYEVQYRSIEDLTPHPDNYKTHPEEQIEEIRRSIREFGIYKNIVATTDDTILAGHGVVEAAGREGYEQIPVYVIPAERDDPLAKKIIAADNELSKMAVEDEDALADLLTSVYESESVDLGGSGFEIDDLDELFDNIGQPPDIEGDGDEGEQQRYLDKVETPTYEPTGDQPDVDSLYEAGRVRQIFDLIEDADLPEEVERFLRVSAYRHVKLDFERIADYYAHAPPEVQAIMEKSALVILDLDDAIEEGYIELTKEVREILTEHPNFNA